MSYRSQTEAALKTYLEGKVGVPVYAGTSDQVKEMPCVIVTPLLYPKFIEGSAQAK